MGDGGHGGTEPSSDHHDMMDIIFAIVVGINLDTWFASDIRGRVFWALVGAYLVVLLSWLGYHRSLAKHDYINRARSTARFFVDYSIVVLYAYLLWIIPKVTDPWEMGRYLAVYAGLFLLYMVSGMVRQTEYGRQASQQGKLWASFTVMALLWAVHEAALPWWPAATLDAFAWAFLFAPIAVYLGWRAWRKVGG